MGNFDFSKCYECQYCYEAKEERSSELYKKEETEYYTISAIQSLKEKPEQESLPKESTTEREKCKEINANASLPQGNQNINVNNNNNNNNNNDIKRSAGDFEEDSSFINDENSKKNSNDINNNNIDEKEKKRSENMEELKRNENQYETNKEEI